MAECTALREPNLTLVCELKRLEKLARIVEKLEEILEKQIEESTLLFAQEKEKYASKLFCQKDKAEKRKMLYVKECAMREAEAMRNSQKAQR